MKNKKKSAANQGSRRSLRATARSNYKRQKSARPFHIKLALHPINILFLLCTGVMLVSFTLVSLAATVTVNASYPAPPLTQPAVITAPANGSAVTSQAITIAGNCPDNSYVNLYNNGKFVGSSNCVSNNFKISLDLTTGENVLTSQDFNVTNSPGPPSTPVTIDYNPTTLPISNPNPPIAVPTTIQVLQLDVSNPFVSLNNVAIISSNPTFAGVAPPYSSMNIMLNNGVYSCATNANAQGYWSCNFKTSIVAGLYNVKITAVTPRPKFLSFPTFKVRVSNTTPANKTPNIPLVIDTKFDYRTYNIGQQVVLNVSMEGGNLPAEITTDWGDGTIDSHTYSSDKPISLNHHYSWVNATETNEVIKIQAIDSSGQVRTLQLFIVLRNPWYSNAVARTAHNIGLWNFYNWVHPLLPLLWPGFLVICLLVLSFWLGEHQEKLNLTKANRIIIKSSGRK
jgi:hypothetical protein